MPFDALPSRHPFVQASIDRFVRDFKVSRSDAEFCASIVLARLEEKSKSRNLFIVPQIADWLEHVMLSDTVGWRNFLADRFPAEFADHVLIESHVMIEAPQDQTNSAECTYDVPWAAYFRSLEVLRENHGLDCLARGFLESGWHSPAYSLRDEKTDRYKTLTLSSVDQMKLEKLEAEASRSSVVSNLLSWLPSRLQRRFSCSQDAARLASVLYAQFFAEGLHDGKSFALPDLISWTWFEHVIAGDAYERDCHRLHGKFIHRPLSRLPDELTEGEEEAPAQPKLAVECPESFDSAKPHIFG